ncbi:MAG: hypothetical protein QXH42_04355 [Thermoplasmata archaeon]
MYAILYFTTEECGAHDRASRRILGQRRGPSAGKERGASPENGIQGPRRPAPVRLHHRRARAGAGRTATAKSSFSETA